ncbi:MAG: hypothetical protein JO040_01780 [Gemmatimonadetes bacterium]|nr:hypothetical protein [Gemmatimonadota bacterium]
MAFLIVNGQTVPVAVDGASVDYELIGDRARAFDGTMRSTRRATKRNWKVKTAPMAVAAADQLTTSLLATPPITCSGDMLGGSVACDAEVTGVTFSPASGGLSRRAVEFTLHEV